MIGLLATFVNPAVKGQLAAPASPGVQRNAPVAAGCSIFSASDCMGSVTKRTHTGAEKAQDRDFHAEKWDGMRCRTRAALSHKLKRQKPVNATPANRSGTRFEPSRLSLGTNHPQFV